VNNLAVYFLQKIPEAVVENQLSRRIFPIAREGRPDAKSLPNNYPVLSRRDSLVSTGFHYRYGHCFFATG
jgi:hypothetical protein